MGSIYWYVVMSVAEVEKYRFNEGMTHRGFVLFNLVPLKFSQEFDSIKFYVY